MATGFEYTDELELEAQRRVEEVNRLAKGMGTGMLITKIPHPCVTPDSYVTDKLTSGAKWKCQCGQRYWLNNGRWQRGRNLHWDVVRFVLVIAAVLLVLGLLVWASIAFWPVSLWWLIPIAFFGFLFLVEIGGY